MPFAVLLMLLSLAAGPAASASADDVDAWLAYRPESAGQHRDIVKLDDGTLRVGKALRWGDEVLVFDAGGQAERIKAVRVEEITPRVDESMKAKPAKPDLTVGWIGIHAGIAENSWELIVHVRNDGGAPAVPFEYVISVDGRPVATGKLSASLAGGEEHEISCPWKIEPGQKLIKVELDTGNVNQEIARWNNTFVDAAAMDGITVRVSPTAFSAFAKQRNGLDTFSFYDWVQLQVHHVDSQLRRAVYPTSPHGVARKIAIRRILIANATATQPAATEDGVIVESADGEMDWRLQGRMLKHFGALPLSAYSSPLNACLVRDGTGAFVERCHRNSEGGESQLINEVLAEYLNRDQNGPRCTVGEYQYALPRDCQLDVRGVDGKALVGVQIEIYQRQASGPMAGFITEDKVVIGATDGEGKFPLPNREVRPVETPNGYKLTNNPFGEIDGEGLAGLMLARLSYGGCEEYHFLSIGDFNLAALRGQTEKYAHRVKTRFAAEGSPARLAMTKFYYFDRITPPGYASFRWPHWSYSGPKDVLEYRAFQRMGLAGDDESPWTMVSIVPPNPPATPPSPHTYLRKLDMHVAASQPSVKDVWLAVAAVGRDGKQAGLSEPLCIPRMRQPMRMAIDKDMNAYIAATDDLRSPVVRWNLKSGAQPFGLRVIRPEFRGYEPAAAGVALDLVGTLVVADERHHKVAWYERGELVRLVGKGGPDESLSGNKDGEFNAPCDVAVDGQERVYVVDRLNHRVQVLNGSGKWLRTIGKRGKLGNEFEEPTAVTCVGERLTVTDSGNHRIEVFDVSGEKPDYRYSLNDLRQPDRALCTPSGTILVCGWDEKGESALLSFAPGSSTPERALKITNQGAVRDARGLCYDPAQKMAFFMNRFPLEIRWVSAE